MTHPYKTGQEAYVIIMASGRGGISAHSLDNLGGSTSIPDRRLRPYYGDLMENGIVIDKETCSTENLIKGVINGPMLGAHLPPNGVSKCGEIPTLLAMGVEGAFVPLVARKVADPEWSGLDYIGIDLYTAFWRDLGARIGRRSGGKIIWEDGAVELIVSAVRRYNNLADETKELNK